MMSTDRKDRRRPLRSILRKHRQNNSHPYNNMSTPIVVQNNQDHDFGFEDSMDDDENGYEIQEKQVMIPELRRLQNEIKEARKTANAAWQLSMTAVLSALLQVEKLEAQVRTIRQIWILKLSSVGKEREEKCNTRLQFSDPCCTVVGTADKMDRSPSMCTSPTLSERLLLRASRVYPTRSSDGILNIDMSM